MNRTATPTLPTPEDVLAAEQRIRGEIMETPLWRSPALSELLGCEAWIKAEFTSPIASFKLRGALNHLLAEPAAEGAVTSSTGNHGQGVAYAAKLLGRRADIFLPEGCIPAKIRALERLGARLHIGGHDIDEAKERAQAFAAANGLTFVDDGESPHVIAGAGTIGLEIGRRLPQADLVLAPMGSGSLASGTALGLRAAGAATRVVAVQSEGSPAMALSFHAADPVERPCATVADCLVQRIPPVLGLTALKATVADAMLVSETEILRAWHTALALAGLLIEPGSAASLAAAWKRRAELAGRCIVLLFTGANVDLARLDQARSLPLLDPL